VQTFKPISPIDLNEEEDEDGNNYA